MDVRKENRLEGRGRRGSEGSCSRQKRRRAQPENVPKTVSPVKLQADFPATTLHIIYFSNSKQSIGPLIIRVRVGSPEGKGSGNTAVSTGYSIYCFDILPYRILRERGT